MTSVYTFAWLASFILGVEAVVAKLMSRHSIANPWLFNFLWSFFVFMLMVPVALYNGAGMPAQWRSVLLASIFSALGSVLYILALYRLDVSVIAPLFSFRTAMAVILGMIFLNETLTPQQYGAIGIIFLFGMFVSIDETMNVRSFFRRATLIALLDMLALAIMSIYIKKAVGETGYWSATLWIGCIAQVWLLATVPFFRREILGLGAVRYGPLAGLALLGTIGSLAATAAYSRNVGISSAIISLPSSLIIAFAFSRYAPELLEKHSPKVYAIRFASAAVMIASALAL